jgi:uncharacterized protein (TIGR00369 family)
MAEPAVTFDLASHVLRAQPFSVLIGAELTALNHGSATLQLTVEDRHKQQNGFLHGGVTSYLADNTMTFAGGSVLGPQVLTAGFTVDFLRPIEGCLVLAVAEVVDATTGSAICRCSISSVSASGDIAVCAYAQGTIRVSSSKLDGVA